MLPQSERVRADRDYRRIFRTSRPAHSSHLTVRRVPAAKNRFGFVVSKKVAKHATVRNLIKRRMRHIVSTWPKTPPHYDAVFIAGPKTATLSAQQLREEMTKLWNTTSYAPPRYRRP